MTTLHVRIVTPRGIYKEMDTEILNIQTIAGDQGILPNHMPLVTMLKIGKLATVEDGKREEYAIAGGLLYFRENTAEVLTDAIEYKDDIDTDRAEAALERARKRLDSNDSNIDLKRAEVALKKAQNRLAIASK